VRSDPTLSFEQGHDPRQKERFLSIELDEPDAFMAACRVV
jgi:hypothetical protein